VTSSIVQRRGVAVALICLFSCCVLSAQQPPAPLQADFDEARLRDWVQPTYPEAAQKAKLEGQVIVDFVVGLDGKVARAEIKDSPNPVFNEAALAAVRAWTFSPALEEAKPVVSGMTVPIVFQLAQLKQKQVSLRPPEPLLPHAAKLVPAKFSAAPDPDYPTELEERKIPGEVQIEFTVDAEGLPRKPRVVWASHAAFVEAALRALEKTTFTPAHQGLLTKPMTMQYPVEFEFLGAKRPEILEANQLTLVGEAKTKAEPVPFVLIEPVYPLEHLLAGEEGTATAEFTVETRGNTANVTLVSASAPEYGAALLAAVEAWGFKPASSDGVKIPVQLRVVYGFAPKTGGNVFRLVEALRPGGSGIAGPSGLDQKLKPLWRGFPVYPAALREEPIEGSAEIEFIIDRDGRARLPRVKSATNDEFGWAAATAISQWVFERPIKKGESVDVTVSIPVKFAPPKPKS